MKYSSILYFLNDLRNTLLRKEVRNTINNILCMEQILNHLKVSSAMMVDINSDGLWVWAIIVVIVVVIWAKSYKLHHQKL